jgi:putative ABC transport system permease protein
VFLVRGDYFAAMGLPLLRGRLIDGRDTARSPRVTLINETMARRVFPGQDPIGQRTAVAGRTDWHEIVGVVADARPDRLDGQMPMQVYGSLSQVSADWGALTFVVRGRGMVPADLRGAIQSVDPGQAVTSIRPLTDLVAGSLARQRFAMVLFAIFSAAALLLAAIGTYGVMAHSVARRTREIGIRLAVGARPGDVLALVLGQGGRLVAAGVTTGVAGALVLTRVLRSMLFGVGSRDPFTFAGIVVFVALIAAVSCLLPARRATRIDPMTALRVE